MGVTAANPRGYPLMNRLAFSTVSGLWSCVMQYSLFLTVTFLGLSQAAQEPHYRKDAVSTPSKPQIYYCRSSNMETFTCWWHPLENTSNSNEKFNYTFMYTTESNHKPQECPDYVTGGPNSCYFDKAHTRVWEMYCMNVSAMTSRGTFTSNKHCLDVADIVEIDPPFNLTYSLMNESAGEAGRTACVSWSYPIPSHVHIGWITLVYELRFRPTADPDNWKVKGLLREPQLELLDLPAGSYEVMVRCRSKNNKIWSQWSSPLIITVPSRHAGDRLLALILITGGGVITFLIIGFGVMPQSKRIKALLLPPIPKPRIRGLDPVLLKKGKMEEINRHFTSFHGYKSPQYREETWYQVYTDDNSPHACSLPSQTSGDTVVPSAEQPVEQPAFPQSQQQPGQTVQTSEASRNCLGSTADSETPEPYVTDTHATAFPPPTPAASWVAGFAPSQPPQFGPSNPPQFGPSHPPPQVTFPPNMGYSLIVNSPHGAMPLSHLPALHDFYTCVSVVSSTGAVQLVPCIPGMSRDQANMQQGEQDSQKNGKLVEYMAKKKEELSNGRACLSQGEVGGMQGLGSELATTLLSQPK
ncbi:prolactin receptor-like isoform X2 [Alosa alosa]|uniref:prolactin receptor-like isoform X2 n=1 Tax=Alosa alosa TaxID=278164 RepID=UPI0020152ACE|nr:prolactin receptor-like isoform X2 [Alosa alosa]